jgi:hypothetical protein
MDGMRTISPILITKTRGFWFGIVPAGLTLVDVIARTASDGSAEPIAGEIAAILDPIFGISAESIHSFMLAVAPLCALIVPHQPRGLARPCTISAGRK